MAKAATVEVIALQPGFWGGGRVREGQKFFVEPGQKAKWFAPVDGEVARAAKPKADKNEPTTLAAADKAGTFNDAVKGKDDKKSDLA